MTSTDQLAQASERLRSASPVFIVGHPRSGTSMLFAALLGHPSFQTRAMDLHESQIMRRLATAFAWNDTRPRQLLGFMLGNRDEYGAFLAETEHLRRSTLLTAPAAVPLRGRIPLSVWKRQKLHLVVRSYFSHAWTARGCHRLVDKSPRHVPHIERLQVVSPNCKMLFIARHPVDTLASYRSRAKRDPNARWAHVSPKKFMKIYREGVGGALQARKRSDAALLITRYEDFTLAPTAEFERICTFLDEPFVEGSLEGSTGTHLKARASSLLYGPVAMNKSHWKAEVDTATAQQVERELSDLMHLMEYEPYT
ncbi:MAG TPA: sulfotransferase [Actinomycetes bacterium]|nr:sulfotransferase [Actinomycetes bacterium]